MIGGASSHSQSHSGLLPVGILWHANKDYAPKYMNLELVSSLGEGCRPGKCRSDEKRLFFAACILQSDKEEISVYVQSHTFGTDCVKRSGGTDKSGFSVRKREDKISPYPIRHNV